jgi:uncharacterized damage-inducible protein DinB
MDCRIGPPAEGEYADFHQGYIAAVANESDGVEALRKQQDAIAHLRRLSEEQANHAYAAGKWTVKEVIGHLADSERVVSYRLLRIARGDQTPLPGFDENAYGETSNARSRNLTDLVDELAAVRTATLTLVQSLDPRVLANRGTVNDWSLTVRGIVFIIAGHFAHHAAVLRDRYEVDV